jgi:hypothetical protein
MFVYVLGEGVHARKWKLYAATQYTAKMAWNIASTRLYVFSLRGD